MSQVTDSLDTLTALQHTQERINKEAIWEEIDNHFGFNRMGDGKRNVDLVQDGGPQIALKTYQSGLMGRLMTPRLEWFTFVPSDPALAKLREVRQWTSLAVQGSQGLITGSNLYTQMHDFFGDGGELGTAVLYRYWDIAAQREVFQVLPITGIYLAEDKDGDVDTVYRYFMMTAQQLVQRFGKENVDDEVLKHYNDPPQRFKTFKVLHAVEPNQNYDPRKRDKAAKKYASCYIDVEHERIMDEGGYSVMPYAIWRNEKPPGEVYGRGPGFRALSDIKGLYAYAKTDITAAQMSVNPVVGIPEEMRGKVQWVPGGRYFYEDAGREPHVPDHKIELRAGLDREQRKQSIIDQHFLVPQFTMMQRLGQDIGDKATLGHIARIEEEIAVHLGPQIAGFNQDVMDKILDGVFQDAWDAELIPAPPRVLTEGKNQRLETVYLGPLAQAQRRFTEQEPYRRAMSNLAALVAVDPTGARTMQVLDNYDFDFISREMSKTDGLPEEAMVDERLRDRGRQEQAKRMQEERKLAAMEQASKAGKAVEPDSVLDRALKARQAVGATT